VTIPSAAAALRIGASHGLNPSVPESDLVVKAVHVQEGDQVEAGQVLVELVDDVFRQVVRQRAASLATAEAELERIQRTVAVMKNTRQQNVASAELGLVLRNDICNTWKAQSDALEPLVRVKAAKEWDLFQARIGVAQSRSDRNTAESAVRLAKCDQEVGDLMDARDLTKAANDCEIARTDLDLARRDLDRCVVKSPLAGYVNKLDLVPGAVVNAGVELGQVFKLSPLHVRVDFPQERLDEARVGRDVDIVLDNLPKETFRGKVIRILPQVRPELRVLPVIVRVDNPHCRLKAGISGFARMRAAKTTLTVPSIAVIESGGKSVVFRVQEGRAHIHEVRTGRLVETGMVEVLSGLAPGDEVVVFHSNFYRHGGALTSKDCYLQDNDAVDVDWRKWARRE
jgi:RND family efflux transporter MFP subunit